MTLEKSRSHVRLPLPVVAIISPTGNLGLSLSSAFSRAAKEGSFALIKLVTSSPENPTLQQYAKDSPGVVKIVKIDYKDQNSWEDALDRVHIVVSAMGFRGRQDNQILLVRAAAKKGIKVYLPSEWGVDYPKNTHPHPAFSMKRAHLEEAETLDLKVVSMTFAIRSSLLAYEDPHAVPSRVRVFSDVMTWNSFLSILESESGEHFERRYIPLEQLISEYEEAPPTPSDTRGVLAILCAEGLHDYSNSPDNELLNAGQRFFKLKSNKEFAREVGGRPWLH